jgi:hypothetical protein
MNADAHGMMVRRGIGVGIEQPKQFEAQDSGVRTRLLDILLL